MTWILPQSLISVFAPDTEASTLASDEQSAAVCARLLMRRSKPSPASSFLREWKAGRLTRLRSGLISNPSLGESFVTAWTSSLEVTPASLSQQPVNDSAKKIPDTSGHGLQMELLPCDPDSVSSRTSKDISPSDSETSSKNWDALVTLRRGEYSQRLKSARLINGSGSSSWPTATTRDWKDTGDMTQSMVRKDGKVRMDILGRVVQANLSTAGSRQESWATATVSTGAHRQADGSMTPKLDQQVKAWATPKASDPQHAGPNMRDSAGNYALPAQAVRESWATPTARDRKSGRGNEERDYKELTPMVERTQSGKLNPRWVETLMGLPVGWVMPSCASPVTIAPTSCDCSATESCQPPQPWPSKH